MTMVEGAVTFRDMMARLAAAVNVATAVSGEGQQTGARWFLKALLCHSTVLSSTWSNLLRKALTCAVWSILQ